MKDKKTLPQMIVLGILVVFCLGYVVVKVTGKKPAPPAAQAKKADSPQSQELAAAPTEDSMVTMPASANTVNQARRDPFTPAMDISDKPLIQRAPTSTYRPSMMARAPMPPLIGLNLRDRLPQVTPYGAGASRSTASSDDGQPRRQEDPLPAFVLTGIITGRTNVAIIRLGEGRYIAKEGQTINGVYKVVSVSQDGVLLSHDGQAFFLKLGGEGNAS